MGSSAASITWRMSSAKMNSIAARASFGTSSRSRALPWGRVTRGAGSPGGNARALGGLDEEPSLAGVAMRVARRDVKLVRLRVVGARDLEGERAAELGELAVQLADAGLARVVADDGDESVVG